MGKTRSPYHLDVTSKFSWCRAGWIFLTCIALTFPRSPTPQDYERYDRFFSSVGWVLPCSMCRDHYNKYLDSHPLPHGQDGRPLSEWLNDLRNEINREHGKPEVPWIQMVASYMPVQQATSMFNLNSDEQALMGKAPKFEKDSNNWMQPCILALLVILIVLALLCLLRVICKGKS
jgi:hypothetical protein